MAEEFEVKEIFNLKYSVLNNSEEVIIITEFCPGTNY